MEEKKARPFSRYLLSHLYNCLFPSIVYHCFRHVVVVEQGRQKSLPISRNTILCTELQCHIRSILWLTFRVPFFCFFYLVVVENLGPKTVNEQNEEVSVHILPCRTPNKSFQTQLLSSFSSWIRLGFQISWRPCYWSSSSTSSSSFPSPIQRWRWIFGIGLVG